VLLLSGRRCWRISLYHLTKLHACYVERSELTSGLDGMRLAVSYAHPDTNMAASGRTIKLTKNSKRSACRAAVSCKCNAGRQQRSLLICWSPNAQNTAISMGLYRNHSLRKKSPRLRHQLGWNCWRAFTTRWLDGHLDPSNHHTPTPKLLRVWAALKLSPTARSQQPRNGRWHMGCGPTRTGLGQRSIRRIS
jgi:hypothetical protein